MKKISARLGGFTLAVEDLRIGRGELIAVIGNNGSGKSTFLHVLSGVTGYTGEYLLDGKDFSGMSRRDVAARIGFLPQTTTVNMPFDAFYVVLTGRFNHVFGRRYTDEDVRRTERVMERFDILHLRDRQFNELSGGERQRILLCRAVNMETDILLLDEPLNAVDMLHQNGFAGILNEIRETAAVIVVIHDLSFAVQRFERFLLFKEGRLLHDRGRDVLGRDELSDVFSVNLDLARYNNRSFVYIKDGYETV